MPSVSVPYADPYATQPDADANRNRDFYADSNSNSHGNSNHSASQCNANSDSSPDFYSHRHRHANSYCDKHAYGNRYGYSDLHFTTFPDSDRNGNGNTDIDAYGQSFRINHPK